MILSPPPQFNYDGPLIEYIFKAPEVDRLCRQAGAKIYGVQIIGCQFFIGERCFIIISDHAIEYLRKHEKDHCGGMKHDQFNYN